MVHGVHVDAGADVAQQRDRQLPTEVLAELLEPCEQNSPAVGSARVTRLMPKIEAKALKQAAKAIAGGGDIATALANARMDITQAGFSIDYVEARNADTLAPVTSKKDGPIRLLVAARIGKTRLIDNLAVPER